MGTFKMSDGRGICNFNMMGMIPIEVFLCIYLQTTGTAFGSYHSILPAFTAKPSIKLWTFKRVTNSVNQIIVSLIIFKLEIHQEDCRVVFRMLVSFLQ